MSIGIITDYGDGNTLITLTGESAFELPDFRGYDKFILRNASGTAVTVTANGSDTIEGETTFSLGGYTSVWVKRGTTEWIATSYSKSLVPAASAASVVSFGGEAVANASGNSTLTIPAGRLHHVVPITWSGSTRTSVVILPVTNRVAYDIVEIRQISPGASSNITQEIRNATAGGTLIYTNNSDDGTFTFRVYFDGTAFQPLSFAQG